MTTYRAATGSDIALGSLTVLAPQPDPGEGLRHAAVIRAGDGSISKQGPYFDFEWSELTNAQFNTILGLFGVASADSAAVTIYIRDESYQNWVRKNGTAQRPFPGDTVRWDIRPKDVVIRVTDLVTAS